MTQAAGSSITIGVTTVLPSTDNNNGNWLASQQATLSQTATIQSISFYATVADGSLRLGVYDASGSGGGPGNKVAETNAFTPATGWNTANVITPVLLPAGTYWLTFLPSSSNLVNPIQWGTGTAKMGTYTFGPMPSTFVAYQTLNVSWSVYATLTTSSGDTQVPTAPTGSTATATSSTQINLSWAASTDNVGVTGYLVERCSGAGCSNFAQVGTPTTTTFSDTGLTASTSYSYRVRAKDAANNMSGYSSTATATTQTAADTQAPSAPTGLTATAASGTQINLSWTASTDNVGVTGYLVERCSGAGCSNSTQIATPTATTYSDTGLTGSTSYSYRVRAKDAANNMSSYSATASATTQAPPDATPPSTPSGLTATPASSTQVNLSWTASTDNIGVTGYLLERCSGSGCSNFTQIATPASTSYTDSVSALTTYSYRVRARDAANNLSSYSNTAGTTPPDCD